MRYNFRIDSIIISPEPVNFFSSLMRKIDLPCRITIKAFYPVNLEKHFPISSFTRIYPDAHLQATYFFFQAQSRSQFLVFSKRHLSHLKSSPNPIHPVFHGSGHLFRHPSRKIHNMYPLRPPFQRGQVSSHHLRHLLAV